MFAPLTRAGEFQVKRVIGLPGDTVAMRGGMVILNSQPLAEPYARRAPARTTGDATLNTWGPTVVPDSSYFVLGDNRAVSVDSRRYGAVGAERMRGRVAGIAFSYGAPVASHGTLGAQSSWVAPSSLTDRVVRWNRIGRLSPKR